MFPWGFAKFITMNTLTILSVFFVVASLIFLAVVTPLMPPLGMGYACVAVAFIIV